MGDVFELPIVKAIKEVEELANIIKEKKKKSEEFNNELEQLKRKCIKYNLKIEEYYTSNRNSTTTTKGGWG